MMPQLIRNVVSSYLVRAIGIVAELATFPVMAHYLGLRAFGILLVLEGAIVVFLNSDIGMGAATIKYVAEAHANEDPTQLSKIISTSLGFFIAIGVVATIVYVASMKIFWQAFDLRAEDAARGTQLILVIGIGSLLIGLPLGVFRNVIIGMQRYDLANLLQILQFVGRSIIVVLLLVLGAGVFLVALARVLSLIVVGIVALIVCRRLLPNAAVGRGHMSWSLLKQTMTYSIQLFAMALLAVIILQTDNFVISAVISVAMVPVYTAGFRIYQACREITNALTLPLAPDAARSHALDRGDRLKVMLVRGTKFANAATLLFAVPATIFAKEVLVTWSGIQFTGSAAVTQILMLGLLANNNHLVAFSLLKGTGRVRAYVKYHVVWAVSNLFLSIILARQFGIAGVALGTTIPVILLEPFYLRVAIREFAVAAGEFLRSSVVLPSALALLAGCPVAIAGHLVGRLNIVEVAVLSIAYAVLFLGLFALVGLDPEEERLVGRCLIVIRRSVFRQRGVTNAAS